MLSKSDISYLNDSLPVSDPHLTLYNPNVLNFTVELFTLSPTPRQSELIHRVLQWTRNPGLTFHIHFI